MASKKKVHVVKTKASDTTLCGTWSKPESITERTVKTRAKKGKIADNTCKHCLRKATA